MPDHGRVAAWWTVRVRPQSFAQTTRAKIALPLADVKLKDVYIIHNAGTSIYRRRRRQRCGVRGKVNGERPDMVAASAQAEFDVME